MMDSQKATTKQHRRKMIAPIIITAFVVFYYILFFVLIMTQLEHTVLKLLFGIVPLLLGAGMIGVCVQRIKEIKGGEEDDLGQY